MKLKFEGKEFKVETEDSGLLREIEKQLPLHFRMRNNGNVEYVHELPVKPVNDARQISLTKTDGVYYYEGWNVLCLNYAANDISPYTVSYIGTVKDPAYTELLKQAGNNIDVTVEK